MYKNRRIEFLNTVLLILENTGESSFLIPNREWTVEY
jgi:hypothetical protein